MIFRVFTLLVLAGTWIPSCSSSNKETTKEKVPTVNLPGVQKITQEFDQKFVVEFNQNQKKITEFSQNINNLNQELITQCKEQNNLSDHCKDVFIRQTELQIKMFNSMATLYNNGTNLMEKKKKAIANSR